MKYYEIEILKNVYLEDSCVLDILETKKEIIFVMDAVLTEHHSLYHQPLPGERYCYKRAKLQFGNINKIEWHENNIMKYKNASGESDYGNIDYMNIDGTIYHLEGDWGEVTIDCKKMNFLIE